MVYKSRLKRGQVWVGIGVAVAVLVLGAYGMLFRSGSGPLPKNGEAARRSANQDKTKAGRKAPDTAQARVQERGNALGGDDGKTSSGNEVGALSGNHAPFGGNVLGITAGASGNGAVSGNAEGYPGGKPWRIRVFGDHGEPVSGANVQIQTGIGWAANLATDDRGSAATHIFNAKLFSITVEHPDYPIYKLDIEPQQEEFVVRLERGGRFKGRVLDKESRKGVAEARIETHSEGPPSVGTSNVSRRDGSYCSLLMPAGVCEIAVVSGNHLFYKSPAMLLGKGEEKQFDIYLDPGRRVRLRLLDAESGAPLARLEFFIGVVVAEEIEDNREFVCDEKGECFLSGLPPGATQLHVSSEGFAIARYPLSDGVMEVALKKEAIANFHVTGLGDRPVRDAGIIFANPSGGLDEGSRAPRPREWDEAHGLLTVKRLAAGPYSATISAQGFLPSDIPFDLAVGQTRTFEVVLQPAPRIRVRLVGGQDEPPKHVAIRLLDGKRGFDEREMRQDEESREFVQVFTNTEDGRAWTNFQILPMGYRASAVMALNFIASESFHEIVLDKGVSLTGTVLGVSKEHLGDIEVEIKPVARQDGPGQGKTQTCKTAMDGSFAFSGLWEGTWQVEIEHPLYLPHASRVTVTANMPPLRIVLTRGASASGRVLARGAPAPGVELQLARVMYGRYNVGTLHDSGKVRSGADGTFTLENLPDGPYGLAATASLDGQALVNFEIRDGRSVAGLELMLRPGRAIEGKVLDEKDTPVEGAKIESSSDSRVENLVPARSTVSAKDGSFRLEGLPEEACNLTPSHSDYESKRSETVPPGEGTIVLRLYKKILLRGQVVTPTGQPVEKFKLFFQGEGKMEKAEIGNFLEALAAANSSGLGRFAFYQDPGHGPIRLVAEAEGYSPGASRTFKLAEYNEEDLKIELQINQTIEVEVRTPTGSPLAEVVVHVARKVGDRRDELNKDIKTGSDGRVALGGLENGDYLLDLTHPDYAVAEIEARVPSNSALRVVLSRGAVIKGHVRDRRGKPLCGWEIRADATSGPMQLLPSNLLNNQATTGEDGNFRIAKLPAGKYRVSITHQDNHLRNIPAHEVELVNSEEKTLELGGEEFPESASLHGVIADPGSLPRLQFMNLEGNDSGEIKPQEGEFTVHFLEPGKYRLFVQHREEMQAYALPQPITLRAGETSEVRIEKPGSAITLEVRVPGREAALLQGGAMVLQSGTTRFAGENDFKARAVAFSAFRNGRAEVPGLAAGRYDLIIVVAEKESNLLPLWKEGLELGTGQKLDLGVLELEEGRVVKLAVRNRSGEQVENAQDYFYDREGRLLNLDSSLGYDQQEKAFLLKPAPRNTFIVALLAENYAPASFAISGDSEVTLQRGGEVAVQLHGGKVQNRGINLISVSGLPSLPSEFLKNLSATSDDKGVAVMKNVPPGRWRAQVAAENPGLSEVPSPEFSVEDEGATKVEVTVP